MCGLPGGGLVRGLGVLDLCSPKRLEGLAALLCSFREKSSLLMSFSLVRRPSFSRRLWVKCRRSVDELSENSWLISDTAAFTSTSIMDKICDSRFTPPAGKLTAIFQSFWRKHGLQLHTDLSAARAELPDTMAFPVAMTQLP